jgi:hypothetical protein
MSVKGIVLFYKGTEISAMADNSVKYHIERTTFYTARAEMLKKHQAEDENKKQEDDPETIAYAGKMSTHTRRTEPIEEALSSAASHERRKRFFEHVRDHVNKEEIYELGPNDLSLFGVTAS